MSPSAYLRGHGNGIFFVREYLRHGIALGQAWTTLAVA